MTKYTILNGQNAYKVSILVPIFNVEIYIERCARSVLEQSYENIEYIFIDDCSPDKSVDILDSILNNYPDRKENVQIIHHNTNRGLAAARNTAIEHARGEFVCHVDSDDYIEKDAIKWLVEKQQESQADIVTGITLQHLKNKVVLLDYPIYMKKKRNIEELLRHDRIYNHIITNRLIRLDLYKKHGIRAKEGCNQGEDWQVMPQLAYYANKMSSIDKIVYHHDSTNLSSMCSRLKKGDLNLWLQDIGSQKVIADFFNDKEEYFANEAKNTALSVMSGYLHYSAKYGRKEFFYNLLNEMKQLYKENHAAIGWDNAIKKAWDSWFWGRHYFYQCRSFVWKHVKQYFKTENI